MDAPAAAPLFSPAHDHASWHTPVSYIFAGLAGLLGLIFIAVFILSCTYLRLIDHQERRRERERSDLEAAGRGGLKLAPVPVLEEKYLVIMAGEDKPTFIATPISGRTSGEKNGISEEERCKKKQECWTCRA